MHESALRYSEISYSCLKTAHAEVLSCILLIKIVSKQVERQLGVCICSCTGAISQVQGEYLERVCTYSRCSTCEQARMSTYTSCCLLCRHGNHVYSTPPEAHQLATGLQYCYGVLMDLLIQWLQQWK